MVAEKDAPANNGPFGWKEWKLPKEMFPLIERERTPHPYKDGRFENDDWFTKLEPDRFDVPSASLNPVRYPNLSPAWTMYRQYGVAPKFKTYFTNIGGQMKNTAGRHCENFELQAMECLEYYGLKQGIDACKDWYDDLLECKYKAKQNLRAKHMFHKRNYDNRLEYYQGKRDHIHEPPPKFHAFLAPHLKPEHYFNK